MLATEPLPESVWDEIGWGGGGRRRPPVHLRPAHPRRPGGPGGRGAPYYFGSKVRHGYDRDSHVHARLEAALAQLLPPAAGARITHRWGGPLGIPRDWMASVGLDRATGLAWAGGYAVGDGVAAANLAGRTLT